MNNQGYSKVEEEILQMKSRLSELKSRHSVIDQDSERLMRKSQVAFTTKTQIQVTVEHPEVEKYRRELMSLINENRVLVGQVKTIGRIIA